MIPPIRYKVGDTTPLIYTIESFDPEREGTVVYDLTNKVVNFSMIMDGAASWAILDAPASIVSASEGTVMYDAFASTETICGMYRILWKVIDSNGKVTTFPDGGTQWMLIIDDRVM